MVGRCYNQKDKRYAQYGGRGITVCDQWRDFSNFHAWALDNGYDVKLTLDRKNVNGNYEPENCRWTTWKFQQNNRTNNHFIEYLGVRKTCQEWSEETGVRESTIRWRLAHGRTIEKALFPPERLAHVGH
jgi:hypothetical protein